MTNNLLDLVYCHRGCCFCCHSFLTPVYAPYLKAAKNINQTKFKLFRWENVKVQPLGTEIIIFKLNILIFDC